MDTLFFSSSQDSGESRRKRRRRSETYVACGFSSLSLYSGPMGAAGASAAEDMAGSVNNGGKGYWEMIWRENGWRSGEVRKPGISDRVHETEACAPSAIAGLSATLSAPREPCFWR